MMDKGHTSNPNSSNDTIATSTTLTPSSTMSPQAEAATISIITMPAGSSNNDDTTTAMMLDNRNDLVPINNNNNKSSGCYLRWSRLDKTVEVTSTQAGLMGKSSISEVGFKKSKSNISSNPVVSATANGGGNNSPTMTNSGHNMSLRKNTPVKKHILKQVAGHAAPGQVLALMGPSGSGKTSLLNVLSGRSTYQGGVISINGQAITTQSAMKRFMSQMAYVKQNDIFFGHLTVRDQLTYTALLRMPRDKKPNKTSNDDAQQSSSSDRNNNNYFHAEVNRILRLLRLGKVADSPIQLVSGGERKRVNIGTELLTDPTVVLLDEPTSGLDSTSAVSLLRLLQNSLAVEQGKTIIMSIHQPSSAMFRSFDQLIMLSEGHVVYFGKPVQSLEYLRRLDLACPDGYNAADHWMDLLVTGDEEGSHDDAAENDQDEHQQQEALTTPLTQPPRFQLQLAWDSEAVAEQEDCAVTLQSSEHGSVKRNDAASGGAGTAEQQDTSNMSKYNTSWWTQYTILSHRALKNSRSAIFTWLNFVKSVALGLTAGLVWYNKEYTEANVHDIRSYLFYTFTYWMFDAMFGALSAFPTERQVILKERASGSYHLSAYFMAKTCSDVPVRLILPTIYMFASYWMTGIDNRFSIFCACTGCALLSSVAGEALGLFLGAAMDDLQNAMTVMTVVTLSLMLLGGFFVENLPFFLNWARYASPFKYVFDSALQVMFSRPVPCDGSGALEELCHGSSEGSVSAQDVLNSFKVEGSIGFNVGILAVIALVPRYLAYVALRMKKDGERS